MQIAVYNRCQTFMLDDKRKSNYIYLRPIVPLVQPLINRTQGNHHCYASPSDLWDQVEAKGSPKLKSTRDAAVQLEAFVDCLSGCDESVIMALISSQLGIINMPPLEVRAKLDALAAEVGISLPRAAKLVSRVGAVWDTPFAAVAAKVQNLAGALRVSRHMAVDLLTAQPGLWAINTMSILLDKVESLATRLALPVRSLLLMVSRQPLLWVIPPRHVVNSVKEVGDMLGLDLAASKQLVARLPVVLVLPRSGVRLSVSGLASMMGLKNREVLDLLVSSLGLAVLPTEVLAAGIGAMCDSLNLDPSQVVKLLTKQPTLLCAQAGIISGALDSLETNLYAQKLAREDALRMCIEQPGLVMDVAREEVSSRLGQLPAALETDAETAASLAIAYPVLLAMSPSTIKSGLDRLSEQAGSRDAAMDMLLLQPGNFFVAAAGTETAKDWVNKLRLPPTLVGKLLVEQPALVELGASTVKARLETLAALVNAPSEVAAQLILKFPALAVLPPSACITRAKSLSLALKSSMESAATLIAKQPAVLVVSPMSELRPYVESLLDVVALYEFYTMEWLKSQAKEISPYREASFSKMHGL